MDAIPQQEPLVNVIDPDTQEVGSLPASEAQQALAQGYTQASPEDVNAFLKHQKYGTPGQQLLTGVEGATSAATFGVIPGFGSKEDIRGRREENPIPHGLGEGLGLIGSSALLPGGGAAGLLSKAGEAASEALVPEGLGALSKIGSSAVKGFTENALFQSGDEISKTFTSENPSQAIEDAIPNIGLAGLLGGGINAGVGAINPLWQATMGPKVGTLLKAISDKAGGIDTVLPDALRETLQTSGMKLSPEVESALSSDPNIRNMFAELQESQTASGVKAQEALRNFKSQASDQMASALGKTKEEVENLSSLSEYDAGKKIQKSLVEELKSKIDPISQQYEDISNKFKDVPLEQDRTIYKNEKNPYLGEDQPVKGVVNPGTTSDISDKLARLVQEKGYNISPSSPEMKMIDRIHQELPNLKTLEDLRNYRSIIGKNISKDQMWDLGKSVRSIFSNAEDQVLTKAIGEKAPELLEAHALARSAYKDSMSLIDDLNSRLHVGKYNGPESFLYALKEMSPEDILRRMSGKGDADLLNLVSEKFPLSAESIKDFHLNNLLKNAASKAAPGDLLNTRNLLNSIQKMSPELKSFVIPSDAMNKLGAVGNLLENLPSKMNPSGTAKTLDMLWNKVPSSGMAMASMLTGHNPVLGFLFGGLGKWIGRDVPDAMKLGLLKFLGSNQPIESEGFKTMVDFIHNTMKGQNLISKATKNVFKAGQEVIPQALIPSQKETEALDKKLMKLRDNPNDLFNVGGKAGHYLPDHAVAIGQYASNSVNYLNAQRPSSDKKAPLDVEIKPTKAQENAFHRTLEIAEQPLMVLDHLKNGTLTPKDLVDFKTLNPSLYQKLSQKLNDAMINHLSDEEKIPYKTRMGLSLFLGQPIDSTLTPEAIMSVQATFQQNASPTQPASESRGGHSMKALSKVAELDQTQSQARQAARLKN